MNYLPQLMIRVPGSRLFISFELSRYIICLAGVNSSQLRRSKMRYLCLLIFLYCATADAFLPKLLAPVVPKDLGGDLKLIEQQDKTGEKNETLDQQAADDETNCTVVDERKEIKEMFNALLAEIKDLRNEVADLRSDLRGDKNSSNSASNDSSATNDEIIPLQVKPPLPQVLGCEPNLLDISTLENGKKYFFSKEQLDWHKAKLICESNKMHLASPKTEAEYSVFYEHLKNLEVFGSLWLSASDVGQAGKGFRWHDGEELPADSPLWDSGSPSNRGTDPAEESCVITGSKLRDQLCTNEKYFACELPPECY